MQFTADSAALVHALGWVSKSLPVRPAVPVLAGVKITVAGSTLTLSGFDYDQSAVAKVDVDVVAEGAALVSGRLLADIVRALPKGNVRFAVEGTKLLVQAKTSKFSLVLMPEHDYPTLPPTPAAVGSVDANDFADAVRSVVPAAGRDDMLPVLTAVCVAIDPDAGQITLAATDRFRLAVRKVPFKAEADAKPLTVLVPARIIDGWAKSLTGQPGSRFTFGSGGSSEGVFAVETEDRSATVRLLDGQYPKYEALIPNDFNTEVVVNAAELIEAVKRVALVAEKSTPASLSFSADGLSLSASADSTASEDVDAKHAGADVTIGFNVGYLLDGLAAMGGREARISLVAGNKPAVVRPVEDEDAYTYLLMPMRR